MEKQSLGQYYSETACGWHNDHGMLTALIPAMYQNEVENNDSAYPQCEEKTIEDKDSGLFILSRNGDEHRVTIDSPHNSIAFQIGETLQLLSGGLLRATPHSVRNPSIQRFQDYGRSTMALFMEPCLTDPVRIGKQSSLNTLHNYLSRNNSTRDPMDTDAIVPSLHSRFTDGMTFGDFHQNTILAFSN